MVLGVWWFWIFWWFDVICDMILWLPSLGGFAGGVVCVS